MNMVLPILTGLHNRAIWLAHGATNRVLILTFSVVFFIKALDLDKNDTLFKDQLFSYEAIWWPKEVMKKAFRGHFKT